MSFKLTFLRINNILYSNKFSTVEPEFQLFLVYIMILQFQTNKKIRWWKINTYTIQLE